MPAAGREPPVPVWTQHDGAGLPALQEGLQSQVLEGWFLPANAQWNPQHLYVPTTLFICSCCVDLTHQSATQLDTMLLTPFICLSYRCLSACFTVSRVGTGLLINQVKIAKGDVSQERPQCLNTAADLGWFILLWKGEFLICFSFQDLDEEADITLMFVREMRS